MSAAIKTLIQGFGLSAGLIVAIGAQNAFVLRQGLKRQHTFAVALASTLCDVFLIALGVGGLGSLIASNPLLTAVARWGGAAFLVYYGLRSFRAALASNPIQAESSGTNSVDLRSVVLAAIGFSLLNPHAILDTVVVIGGIGAQFPSAERGWFAMGAMLASSVWFFSLAYGAAWLAPLFQHPRAVRVLEALIGCLMFWISASLILGGSKR